MMWRRLLAILLVLTLFFTFAYAKGAKETEPSESTTLEGFNEVGLPIVEEIYTLNFTGMNMNSTRVGRYDETDMMLKLQADTNVKIVWNMIPQASWKEKKNLIIASGELPDGFMGPTSLTADEAQQLGAEGVLIPLEDLIKKYAPNIQAILILIHVQGSSNNQMVIYALSSWQDMGFDSLRFLSLINMAQCIGPSNTNNN